MLFNCSSELMELLGCLTDFLINPQFHWLEIMTQEASCGKNYSSDLIS